MFEIFSIIRLCKFLNLQFLMFKKDIIISKKKKQHLNKNLIHPLNIIMNILRYIFALCLFGVVFF